MPDTNPSETEVALPSRGSESLPAVPIPPDLAPSSPPSDQENKVPYTTEPSTISPSYDMDSSTDGNSGNSLKFIIGLLVAMLGLIIIIVLFFIIRSRATKTVGPWKTGLSGQLQKAFVTWVPKLNRDELETACEDFSNIIYTHEGVATLYKGTLSSGVEIAVASTIIKSAKEWSKQAELLFRKKIDTLSRVNHKTFINVIGYCEEDEPFTRMMVFEYAPNGPLYDYLHVKELEDLGWEVRIRVIMGATYCLQHMHELNPPVPLHCLTSKESCISLFPYLVMSLSKLLSMNPSNSLMHCCDVTVQATFIESRQLFECLMHGYMHGWASLNELCITFFTAFNSWHNHFKQLK